MVSYLDSIMLLNWFSTISVSFTGFRKVYSIILTQKIGLILSSFLSFLSFFLVCVCVIRLFNHTTASFFLNLPLTQLSPFISFEASLLSHSSLQEAHQIKLSYKRSSSWSLCREEYCPYFSNIHTYSCSYVFSPLVFPSFFQTFRHEFQTPICEIQIFNPKQNHFTHSMIWVLNQNFHFNISNYILLVLICRTTPNNGYQKVAEKLLWCVRSLLFIRGPSDWEDSEASRWCQRDFSHCPIQNSHCCPWQSPHFPDSNW